MINQFWAIWKQAEGQLAALCITVLTLVNHSLLLQFPGALAI